MSIPKDLHVNNCITIKKVPQCLEEEKMEDAFESSLDNEMEPIHFNQYMTPV